MQHILTSYKTADGKWNESPQQQLRVSMENQTTTFFGLPVIIGLVNERKQNIKL